MSQKSSAPPTRVPAEKLVRDIRRATRKHHSAEDKIRIVLEGLRGEESIAALCRREAIAESGPVAVLCRSFDHILCSKGVSVVK
jgi:transposase